MRTRPLRLVCLALVAGTTPLTVGAQDSLRVLRFSPASPASLVDPVVVTFDHPVAPRLNLSVDPRRAISVSPDGGSTTYWRDPSTLVVDFNRSRPGMGSYVVKLDPGLRSVDGRPLARRDTVPRTIAIRGVQVLLAESVRPDGLLDPIARVKVVVSSPMPRERMLRARLMLYPSCDPSAPGRAVPFTLEGVRAIDMRDDGHIREAGGFDRDRRIDSLRRVMDLVAERPLPRGCAGQFEVVGSDGGSLAYTRELRVEPGFAILPRRCGGNNACAAGPFVLQFNQPVLVSEIRAQVQVDGIAPMVGGDSASTTWRVHAGFPAGTEHTLRVSRELRSVRGESLGTDVSEQLLVPHAPPAIAFSVGSFVQPRSTPILIGIRHTNTDSVVVIVGRVADSSLAAALAHRPWYGGASWKTVVRDSVVLRYATPGEDDGKSVLTAPMTDLPRDWRDASILAVRAIGVARPMQPVSRDSAAGSRPPIVTRASNNVVLPFAVLRRSNIAIHLLDAEGEVRAWVTSLRDGRSLAGARVRVVDEKGRELARATSDTGGMTVLRYSADTGARANRLMVEARHGDDLALQLVTLRNWPMRRPSALASDTDDDFDFYYEYGGGVEPGSLTRLHGAAFSERGIYRPGEHVFLKGVARRYDARSGYATPRGDSARWVVRWMDGDGGGERVWTRRRRLGEFGSMVDTFTVPRTARLGNYSAVLAVARDGRWHSVASTSFAVAEYRVPEFAVRVTIDSTVPLFARDTARVEIAARYLFGVPMQHARVDWWAETKESNPWEVRVRGLDGFNVGRSWWLLPGGTQKESPEVRGEQIADDDGRAVVRVPLGTLDRPGRLTLHATVTDANRQTVTSDLSVPVHAADLYVGARLAQPRWVWQVGDTIPVRALVVDAKGARQSGIPVRVLAIRHRWEDNRRGADTVWRETRTVTTDTLRVAFTPDVPGQYELLLTVRDAKGRDATTGVYAWVTSTDARWARTTSSGLTLTADRQRYLPGEQASIRIESSDDGPAWVTLTRVGILWEERIQLQRGTNVITVPIPSDASPGVELSAVALRPRVSSDSSEVYYRRHVIRLEVGRDANLLNVAVVPDRVRYQPRDTVRLALAVKDAAGRGVLSELAVWAVDEGVTSLTAMERPDLLLSLLAWSASAYSFSTTLAAMLPRLVPEYMMAADGTIRLRGASSAALPSRRIPVRLEVPAPGAMLSEVVTTAMGAAPAVALRQYFSTTPLYRGAVPTGADGTVRLEFVLPDNLTTFRLFAVAIAEGARAGSGDTAVVSTRTLAVRPALPRVIRDGDRLFAGAVITQDRDGRTPVTLRAEGAGVRITGPAARTDSLDGRLAREIRFDLRGIAADTAVLRFYGNTRRDADAAEARLPVSPAGHARAHVVMGTLVGSARLGFRTDDPLDAARSRLEVQVGSSPVPLLQRLSESLRIYPYYCTEQLSSGGRAMVARIRAERMIAPAAALSPRDRAQLEMGVATIVARQREDGGFGYWSSDNWTTPWLTSYALEFLDGAHQLGVEVPAGVLVRARGYLTDVGPLARISRYATNGQPDSLVQPHDALAATLVLRSLQHPDTALERRVLRSASAFDWVDRLSLARLLARRGDIAGARAIVDAAWRATRVAGRRIVLDDSVAPRHWIFRSVTRPIVALLTTTADIAPEDPRLEPLFESMLQVGRSERTWSWNTIDQALVADAVVAMLQRRAPGDSTVIAVSGHTPATGVRRQLVAGTGRSDTLRASIPAFRVPTRTGDSVVVGLKADSDRPVYYAATLFEIPTARPVRADDAGISVDRWYERYDDPRPVVEVRAGELVRVRIRVTVTADREFVVIDDPLPAGIEAVDLSLRTSSVLPPFEGAPRIKAEEQTEGPIGQRWRYGRWDGGWWVPWEHREIRDDRVVYFARQLWKGSYLISYVARATTAGTFVRPPTHAEEMYNPALHGRSDGGVFTVTP